MTQQKQGVSNLTKVLIGLVGIALIGYLAMGLGGSGSGNGSGAEETGHKVIYMIDGSGTVSVGYESAEGKLAEEIIEPPWATDFRRAGNRFVYIHAVGTGRLECTILVDGMLVEEKSGIGEATCEGLTE